MAIRVTTNGTLNTYKSNLMRSSKTLNDARNKVLTQRNFNSFAEDPAAAAQSFQLRRSFWRVDSQITSSTAVINSYNAAWNATDDVVSDIGNELGKVSALRGLSGSTAAGRNPLGQVLDGAAKSALQTMNAKYGDSFVFAGSDGLNVPFSWDADGKLLYRNIPVDAGGVAVPDPNLPEANWPTPTDPAYNADWAAFYKDQDNLKALEKMNEETTYVDLGMGMQEDLNGNLIATSAFNSALSGIDFLGYGVDADGDPKNVVSIMKKIGDIFKNCNSDDGSFNPSSDEAVANRLTTKLEKALSATTGRHTELDTDAKFLNTNLERLETTADTLNEQILSIEQIDLGDAITSMSWAQSCYNAALKVGNSILSQSLLDYMR